MNGNSKNKNVKFCKDRILENVCPEGKEKGT